MLAESSLSKEFIAKIRRVNGWPIKGIEYLDLNPVMADRALFSDLVYELEQLLYEIVHPDIEADQIKIAGIEARGFIWGAAVAQSLGSSFVPIRKVDDLPPSTVREISHVRNEYADNDIALPKDCVNRGDEVVVIDDVLATGQTALGAYNLLTWAGAEVLGIITLIKIKKLKGESCLGGIPTRSLVDV